MKYRFFFFDLDGTVINSAPGVGHSIAYAFRKFGIKPPEGEELRAYIGPPLTSAFEKLAGMSHEDSLTALDYYRECYRSGAMFECDPYPGIPELLRALNACGGVCALATCKPLIFARQIIEHLGLAPEFAFLSGPELDGTRGKKSEVIQCAMEHLGVTDLSEVLMIGDRDNDVNGAKEAGVDCAGTLWGFGSAGELLDAGAKYLFATADEAREKLTQNL